LQQNLRRLRRLGCAECREPGRRADLAPEPLAGSGQRRRRDAREGHAHTLSGRAKFSCKVVPRVRIGTDERHASAEGRAQIEHELLAIDLRDTGEEHGVRVCRRDGARECAVALAHVPPERADLESKTSCCAAERRREPTGV
jgi:hypothetical protein